MIKTKLVYLNLVIISASILCFEIIATRISSVIFEYNYAFIILSIAILGIGSGGIYSFYKINSTEINEVLKTIVKSLGFTILSLVIFVLLVTETNLIVNHFIFLLFLIIPFFFAGIVYSLIFKIFSEYSFKLYAADLAGAAFGSILSIGILDYLGAVNSVFLIIVLLVFPIISFISEHIEKRKIIIFTGMSVLLTILIIINAENNLLGKIPIGNFPEKDYYYVYPDAEQKSEIIESRWSIFGRSDLVQYNDQDMVKQLFVDGAAGSPMYRFNGNIKKPGNILLEILLSQTNAIPFLCLNKNEKNNMLVIGPGGGKEVLLGLFSDIGQIKGVEINPDFVNLVKDYKDFNGGIYTNFPNVDIQVSEGRHYIKDTDKKYDLLVMALPSTEQIQNIDALAMNENYLLTVEAIKDYMKILTNEGQLIFTVHNNWELVRLIITSISAFEELGIQNKEFLNHIAIIEGDYSPTIVIKKNPFTYDELVHWQNIIKTIPKKYPAITYLSSFSYNSRSTVNQFLEDIKVGRFTLNEFIKQNPYNIKPCRDDSPYFYKITKGISEEYIYLIAGVAVFNLFIIAIPLLLFSKRIKESKKRQNKLKVILLPLIVFISIGLGFMVVEVSLFQKLVLYLGSPTISLSLLLSSLLVGMGTGSYFGKRIFIESHQKRLFFISLCIVSAGIILIFLYPLILGSLLKFSIYYRAIVTFILILPLGFLLGIPFPTSIQLLKTENNENLIPWMYGINGAMSVLGSIMAVVLSMLFGFTISFFVGLFFYFLIILYTRNYSDDILVLKAKKDLIV